MNLFIDAQTRELIENFGSLTDELHTDLHECLGHGSGKLLSGVDPDLLKIMEILLKKHEQICLDSIIWLTKIVRVRTIKI